MPTETSRLDERPSGATCQDVSGFLFKHPCERRAMARCAACKKAICDDHRRLEGARELCIACFKLEERSLLRGADPAAGAPHTTGGKIRRAILESDPYFYADVWYPHYGHFGPGHWGHAHTVHSPSGLGAGAPGPHPRRDPDDFHEGDAEHLRRQGDEAFERDMEAS